MVAHRAGQRHRGVPYGVLRRGLVIRLPDPSGQHGGRVVPGQTPVRVVQHDLALARMRDDAGLQIVAHQAGRGTAEPLVHRHMGPQPRVLRHAERGYHERVPAERRHGHERIRR